MRPRLHPPHRPAAGPVVLLLPLVFLVLSLLYMTRERRAPSLPHELPAQEVGEVRGWTGVLELASGDRLYARLARLHSQDARQEFDAAALAQHFDLAGGEPWRLVLRRVGPAAADVGPLPELRLDALAVTDARGVALRVMPRPGSRSENAVADPLAVLLAPPPALCAGEELSLVLWGRPPGDQPRLAGIGLAPAGGTGIGALALALAPQSLEAGPDEEALARLETFSRLSEPVEEDRNADDADDADDAQRSEE